jgi:hypothetical protein
MKLFRPLLPHVFICYSSEDKVQAIIIQHMLVQQTHFDVLLDTVALSSEKLESLLFAEIDRSLSSGYVLVLLSPSSLKSSSWWTEVLHAMHNSVRIGRHAVIPVLVAPLEQADWPSQLTNVQWFDLTSGPFDERVSELIHTLETGRWGNSSVLL